MIDLSNLKSNDGSVKNRKRLGRGPGSGLGKTSGKGHKGQKCRSGYKSRAWNEGGQMPLQRRLPKRGFTNIFRVDYQEIAVSRLSSLDVNEITPEVLHAKGLISKKRSLVKVLGGGEIDKALTIKAHAFSKSAREKIEKAGGIVEIIEKPEEDDNKAQPPASSGSGEAKSDQD